MHFLIPRAVTVVLIALLGTTNAHAQLESRYDHYAAPEDTLVQALDIKGYYVMIDTTAYTYMQQLDTVESTLFNANSKVIFSKYSFWTSFDDVAQFYTCITHNQLFEEDIRKRQLSIVQPCPSCNVDFIDTTYTTIVWSSDRHKRKSTEVSNGQVYTKTERFTYNKQGKVQQIREKRRTTPKTNWNLRFFPSQWKTINTYDDSSGKLILKEIIARPRRKFKATYGYNYTYRYSYTSTSKTTCSCSGNSTINCENKTVQHLSPAGLCIKEQTYNENVLETTRIFAYDANGLVQSEALYDAEGNLLVRFLVHYYYFD